MIKGRAFLVGCERSGTTLLQSLLATQPMLVSFPESHFFDQSIHTRRDRWLVHWDIRPPAMRRQLCQVAQQFGDHAPSSCPSPYQIGLNTYIAAFIKLLDNYTVAQQKSAWLEKTPRHLQYIDLIERYVAGVRFIHVVRNGADVVASLYHVTNQHPKQWNGEQSLDQCIARWQKAIQITHRHLAKPNHLLVRYEALVANPTALIGQVCNFLEIPFQPELLVHYGQQADTVILADEPWKAGVKEPITNRNGLHFTKLFDEQQRRYINEALATVAPLLG